MDTPAIAIDGLKKRFGKVEALRGIDLRVRPSSVLGLLGPNGAGKTTAVRILTTLLHPDEATATVLGMDVVGVLVGDEHGVGAVQRARVREHARIEHHDAAVGLDPHAGMAELGEAHASSVGLPIVEAEGSAVRVVPPPTGWGKSQSHSRRREFTCLHAA